MTAVESARQSIARLIVDYGVLPVSLQPFADLLAEIDAGVWLDTREVEALADEHGLCAVVNEDPGQTGSDTSDDCAWIVEYGLMGLRGRRETPYCATAADAVRAAREAQ